MEGREDRDVEDILQTEMNHQSRTTMETDREKWKQMGNVMNTYRLDQIVLCYRVVQCHPCMLQYVTVCYSMLPCRLLHHTHPFFHLFFRRCHLALRYNVQQKHPQSNVRVQHIECVLQRVVSGLQCVVLTFEP